MPNTRDLPNKMVANLASIFVVMILVATYIAKTNSAICQCACCIGQGCKLTPKPPLFIPSCENGACGVTCTTTYPKDCAVSGSMFTAACSNSAISTITSRHALFIIFCTALFAPFMKQVL